MRIDFSKLRDQGFDVRLNKSREHVDIYPVKVDEETTKKMREFCDLLGFNDAESDQFFTATHHIQVMSAIRKCSNW